MNTLRVLGLVAGLSLAGAAYAQSPRPPDQATPGTNPSGQTVPDQTIPGGAQPAAPVPDQANSATYPAPPDSSSANPSSASSPHQRDVTSQMPPETPPSTNPDPAAAASPHQQSSMRMATAGGISTGMDVQSSQGHALGTVVNVVNDSSGKPAYVVIADQAGGDTPVPYATARHMVRGNRMVVDSKRLQEAPKVPESQLQNSSSKEWQSKADSYWGRKSKQRG